ncbi:MAG TPA: hypothetical protein VHW60_13930 [Caulobacteraceae bacterium]|jgi:hypothetical protein|nr:hypothetical protein [Caulobacteraceae bacterium]
MNGFPAKYWGFAAALALLGPSAAVALPTITPPPAHPSPVTTAAIAAAEAPSAYPSFASIPVYPKDLRPLSAWKSAIVSIQSAGAALTQRAATEPWTLANTEVWAADERAIATPPPRMENGPDTAAFIAEMRARATPPPPLHHTAGAAPASHP